MTYDCNYPLGTIPVVPHFIKEEKKEEPITVSLEDFQKMYATIPDSGIVALQKS